MYTEEQLKEKVDFYMENIWDLIKDGSDGVVINYDKTIDLIKKYIKEEAEIRKLEAQTKTKREKLDAIRNDLRDSIETLILLKDNQDKYYQPVGKKGVNNV